MKIYLDRKFSSNQNQLKDTSVVYYFKLPYIDNLPRHIKNKLSKFCEEFFKGNFNIKLVFNSLKIHIKIQFLINFKSFLVYKIICATCSSSYIGQTCSHFKTRIEEYIKKDNNSIFFNIYTPPQHAFDSYNSLFFNN